MGTAIRRRLRALGCALSLLLCLPLVKPWLDMGTVDDVSYTRSAQLLAQTGHIVYNGWATAMLGWQLYLGAAFIKLFGFSFNVTRLSMFPVAMVTAFISQRSMVRAGLSERNATLATLTLVLSPMFLPLAFSYMSDVPGLLIIVLCFYGCLRALQANSDANASLWLAFSAVAGLVIYHATEFGTRPWKWPDCCLMRRCSFCPSYSHSFPQ
jgi:Dolichyl-phosphate-mannose-protein mannosyltransferase